MGNKAKRIVASGGTGIRHLLFLTNIANDILVSRTFTDNHAFIDLNARTDKQTASVLSVEKAVARAGACFMNDDRAAFSGLNITLVRLVSRKELIHNAVAVGVGHELRTVADKASCGDLEFKVSCSAVP